MTIRADVIPSQHPAHSDLNPDSETSLKHDTGAFRKMREARGLTQRDVARGAGVTPNTIAKLERGERVTLGTLRKVSAFLATVEVNPVLVALLRPQGR